MRALISVSDKRGIVEFAKKLELIGYEIISTGGTYSLLKENGIEAIKVSSITNFPEILEGRVKTLHPNIHGGILYKRSDEDHVETINKNGIEGIDLVVVNLYPFEDNLSKNLSYEDMMELIDIGGPSMIRSAAKNSKDVLVVCDFNDYDKIIEHCNRPIDNLNKYLAGKAFNLTAHYDSIISNYFNEESYTYQNISTEVKSELRYGENPHQKAMYSAFNSKIGFNDLDVLQGKELSYNNYLDVDAALNILCDFKENILFSLKHSNPCAVSTGDNLKDMYQAVYEIDPISIFGGIIATNMTIDSLLASKINEIFVEIIIAKDFTDEALAILKLKKNVRLIRYGNITNKYKSYRGVMGGIITQEVDSKIAEDIDFKQVSKVYGDINFKTVRLAYSIVKHVKSNAIVAASKNLVVGVGAGQMNRIDSAKIALKKARDHSSLVIASDAFFPFSDIVELCGKYDVATIVQPGGSINDEEVIKKCNELKINLLFTGVRSFKH